MEIDVKGYRNRHTLKNKIGRALWRIVWLILFRPTPDRFCHIFIYWRAMLLRLFGAKVKHCAVYSSTTIWAPWNIEIGDMVAVSEDCDLYSVAKISIGDRSTISKGAFLCTASHDVNSPIMELTSAPITIGHDVWVAARAIVLPGITIGDGAVVGAGAIVTKDVAPWTIVAGNPARVVGARKLSGTGKEE